MNNIVQNIYEALSLATGEEVGTFCDDDKFLIMLDLDSLTTAVFLIELETHFSNQFDLQGFNREITFGELKTLLRNLE